MQTVHGKLYCYNGKIWDNLEPIVNTTIESFFPVAADEVTERVDSAGNLEEEKLSSVRSLVFEDPEEDGSGSTADSEDEPDDPRVQEEVCSRNDGISNSTEIGDFLKLV